ncbi:NUDIX hydrolase domain-like protein [Coemansia spiralis]|nr:NUDIX hydrolase domain-like protein [Coemansia spiralis]
MSLKYFTLVFPFNITGDQVLLGLKKRGLGENLWNGFGGKPEKNESIEQCARRELEEECGLVAKEMTYLGVLYINTTDGVGDIVIYVYTTRKYMGAVAESDEMLPEWFETTNLPYKQMYEEAPLWYPVMLGNKKFTATFLFDNDDLISYEITTKDELEMAEILRMAQDI